MNSFWCYGRYNVFFTDQGKNRRIRSSLVNRASDCQCTSCNSPGFDPSIRRHSGIWGAADEGVLNIVRKKQKIPPSKKNPQTNKAAFHQKDIVDRVALSMARNCKEVHQIPDTDSRLDVSYIYIHSTNKWKTSLAKVICVNVLPWERACTVLLM